MPPKTSLKRMILIIYIISDFYHLGDTSTSLLAPQLQAEVLIKVKNIAKGIMKIG